jgi:hypothetical protein
MCPIPGGSAIALLESIFVWDPFFALIPRLADDSTYPGGPLRLTDPPIGALQGNAPPIKLLSVSLDKLEPSLGGFYLLLRGDVAIYPYLHTEHKPGKGGRRECAKR